MWFEVCLIERIVRLLVLYGLSDGDCVQLGETDVGLIAAVDGGGVEEEVPEEADED